MCNGSDITRICVENKRGVKVPIVVTWEEERTIIHIPGGTWIVERSEDPIRAILEAVTQAREGQTFLFAELLPPLPKKALPP
jgi:hypothetical protein